MENRERTTRIRPAAPTAACSVAPLPEIPRPDRCFGRIACEKGLVTPPLLQECVEEQQRELRDHQVRFRIGQILLRRKIITVEQFVEILREQEKRVEPPIAPAFDRSLSGRYRLIREIAQGGMATVYLAQDLELERNVAVKVIRKSTSRGDEIRRLRREAALAAQLAHPNIIAIHEFGMIPEERAGQPVCYIVMEFVDGVTLETASSYLARDVKLRILETVAAAAGYAHRCGVVHRDLKPANILLSTAGRPVITDFGLAYEEGEGTTPGEISGTPLYMAPEQIEGNLPAGPRTDVWALGVMLYEILTGKLPFDASTTSLVWRKILRYDPIPPRMWGVYLPEGVPDEPARICLKALQKDPHRRYSTGEEMAEELRRWREEEATRFRLTAADLSARRISVAAAS